MGHKKNERPTFGKTNPIRAEEGSIRSHLDCGGEDFPEGRIEILRPTCFYAVVLRPSAAIANCTHFGPAGNDRQRRHLGVGNPRVVQELGQ